MPKEFRLPPMSATMEEANIVRWLKSTGESVRIGEPMLEVESDKATLEVESPYSGQLARVLYGDGQTVPVGAIIAIITEPGEDGMAGGPDQDDAGRSEVAPTSPSARRLAQQLGVDLREVKGTGARGRITPEDVQRAAQAKTAQPTTAEPAGTETGASVKAQVPRGDEKPSPQQPAAPGKLSPMRLEIVRAVSLSHAQIPSFWVGNHVRLAEVIRLQQAVNRGLDERERLTLTDFFLQAMADCLAQFPTFSQRVVTHDDQIGVEPLPPGNVGLIVALEDGLLGPVVSDISGKGLIPIASQRRSVVSAARGGQLIHGAHAPAAMSISNVTSVGIERFQAIIQPGQSAILAIGSVREIVVAQDGAPAVVPGCDLVLTVDHRIIDGIKAAHFLRALVDRIESGSWRLL